MCFERNILRGIGTSAYRQTARGHQLLFDTFELGCIQLATVTITNILK